LTPQCTAIKPNGERCKLAASGQHGLCWAHSPENAQQRRRTASRGGKGKPSQEIRALKKQLEDLAAGVLDGTLERANAVVVNQILNTRARLIELERKVKETEELEERLEALERAASEGGQRGSGRWGT
jgi:hypothetical protein